MINNFNINDDTLSKLYSCVGKIVKDSRYIKNGDVFIAIKGDKFDGHDFVESAINNGAKYAIVNHFIPNVDENKLIVVPDTLQALNLIAKYVRDNSTAIFIAITGSCGKTSTKEMLKHTLSVFGKTYVTAGNLNNLIGLPFTLANMPMDTKFAVLEMGMNHTGEIDIMTKIVRPNIAVVMNVGVAHHEFFPTINDIAMAKAEIFHGFDKNSIAIINNHNCFDTLKNKALLYTNNIFSFGESGDFFLKNYDNSSRNIVASISDNIYSFSLNLYGKHQAINSLAVLGVVNLLELDINKAIKALSDMSPVDGRGVVYHLKFDCGKIYLIDDAYNANPNSMKAAIEVLGSSVINDDVNARKIAVIGDMKELGDNSRILHEEILDDILKNRIDTVFCCGQNMKYLYQKLPKNINTIWCEDSLTLWNSIKNKFNHNDVVLVKGSLGSNMVFIVNNLKQIKIG